MALRIAFDLDGVLADMNAALAREAERLFGRDAEACIGSAVDPAAQAINGDSDSAAGEQPAAGADIIPPQTELNLSGGQTRRLWEHVRSIENFWESLDEVEPGVVARIASVAAERRWEIIFLTRRPETAGSTAQVQTQRWLTARGFALPSVFVVQGSRGRIAAALGLDIVIDDRPENCLDVVVDSKARAILVWRQEQKSLPQAARRLGIGAVRTVGECLDILVEIDRAPASGPGVVERVKRLLGLSAEVASM